MTYLLDTNTCIWYLRQKRKVFDAVNAVPNYEIGLSVIELRFGAELSHDRERAKSEALDFISPYETVPVSPYVEEFVIEKARLQTSGRLIDNFDLLIGAAAIGRDLTLVTNNTKHFMRLAGIRLEDWS